MTEKKIISYSHLFRRALELSIEFALLMILIFYLPQIIQLIKLIYGLT